MDREGFLKIYDVTLCADIYPAVSPFPGHGDSLWVHVHIHDRTITREALHAALRAAGLLFDPSEEVTDNSPRLEPGSSFGKNCDSCQQHETLHPFEDKNYQGQLMRQDVQDDKNL